MSFFFTILTVCLQLDVNNKGHVKKWCDENERYFDKVD